MNTDEEPQNLNTDEGEVTFEELDNEGEGLSPSATIKKLREKLKTVTAEKQENLLGWQRMKADYVNAQKASNEAFGQIEARSKSAVIHDILPVLDSFDLAMSNQEAWQKVENSWRVGVEYIYQQLNEALAQHGVESFGKVGDLFDPILHQPVSHDGDTSGSGTEVITKVLQRGFKQNGNIIRPAKVIIGYK